MPVAPVKNYRKPRLRPGDQVLLITHVEGALSYPARISSCESVGNGRAKMRGDASEYDETGMAPGRRAVFIPEALRASWARSSFLKDVTKLGRIMINPALLNTIDAENEKRA